MSTLGDIITGVWEAKRSLLRHQSPVDGGMTGLHGDVATFRLAPTFNSRQVEAVLRVEVSVRLREDLWAQACDDRNFADQLTTYFTGKLQGPLTVEGVALYFVSSLPAPGWRVVNPLAVR